MRLSRSAAIVVSMLLVSCSSGDASPPPATRDVGPTVATFPPETTPPVVEATDDSTPDEPVDAPASGPLDATISFQDLGGGVEGGLLTVPLDYSDPAGETIDLWVTRHRTDSDGRAGVLLTNNGGPGVPASSIAMNVNGWFDEPIVERFDVVSWDPRGTGRSGGSVDCIRGEDYDRFFAGTDITPDDDGEKQAIVELAQDFADRCVAAVGADVLPHLGTNNSARDMDAIRRALGEPQVSYLGFSYGSELGAVWATLFPSTVRSAVFDGAAHPDPDGLEPLRQQHLGFARVLDTFLAQCSAEESCQFHSDGDAEAAFDELMASLDDEPLAGPAGRPEVGQEIAVNAVVQAMYNEDRWPALERALSDAADGDGAGLLAFHDSYFQRDPLDGSYTNLLESFQAINCADQAERLSVEERDEQADEIVGVAPRLFLGTTPSYTCDFFPASADPRLPITGDGAGPIVVVGTTGDPSTPLDSSAAMADALEEGQLVVVEGNHHTSYRVNGCARDLIHEFLIWLETPPLDSRC